MIPILTKHLGRHGKITTKRSKGYTVRCTCSEMDADGWSAHVTTTVDALRAHHTHVAATFQAALDAAGATTRTEWCIVPGGDIPVTPLLREEYARHVSATQGVPLVSRTVVTMPWQPAEEVEDASSCGCAACSTLPIMHVCSVCGSKRCAHAADHNRPCAEEVEA